MRITNKHGLPDAVFNAVNRNQRTPDAMRMSVTDLISPPQIRQLKIKHWDEIEEDASQRLWALLGSAVHYILEKGSPDTAIAEEKLTYDIDGFTLVGVTDLLHGTELSDYKVTSVYSFLLGDKPEWQNQLNCNAFLFRKAGFDVEKLTIHAILRDFQPSKAGKDVDYPLIPFQSVPVPLWTLEGQERYIKARIEAHKALNATCSDEERWLRGEAWAVYKKSNKTAFRVFDNPSEAESLASTDNKFEVQHRQGKFQRCKSYCPVRSFCPQWQKEKEIMDAQG